MPSHPGNQHRKILLMFYQCDVHIQNSYDLLALKTCLKSHDILPKVIEAVVRYYVDSGINELDEDGVDIPHESLLTAEGIVKVVDFENPQLIDGLSSYHWLMGSKPRDELVSVLSTYPLVLFWPIEWVTTGLDESLLDTDSSVQLGMTLRSTISRNISSVFP